MSGKQEAEEEYELHTGRKAGCNGLGLLRGFFFFPFLKSDSVAELLLLLSPLPLASYS